MSKKENNYYSPTNYQKYRNASKAMKSSDNTQEEYSVHNDEYFYRQIQAENKRHTERQDRNKPENPKPPVNVKKTEEKSKHYSVYDEIAERHRKEKEKNGDKANVITPLKPITPVNTQVVAQKLKSEKTAKTERKIIENTPITEEETEDFINRVNEIADIEGESPSAKYYTQQDIEEICEYYRKKYSRKMWITLICSLSFFCILIAGMYLYINGYMTDLFNFM